MKKDPILKIVRIVIYASYLLSLSLVFLYDAGLKELRVEEIQAKFNEDSLTERFQEFTFLMIVILCFVCSWLYPKTAALSFLMGGFFLMAFIREFDAFLDHKVHDGAWQVLVLIVLATVLYKSYQNRKALWNSLPNYLLSYPFGIMISGMIITFAYSRLIGESIMWQTVMEENYIRNVKNAVEESVELLGDSIILFGVVEFFMYAKAIHKKTHLDVN
ncbi:MAG: hypothetical protein MJA30_13590 [Cytophagales bacterium]|nr:hypothetical protein [Cytophagales bacterium]